MPSANIETSQQLRGRRRLQQLAATATKQAHQACAAERREHQATEGLKDLETRHPELSSTDLRSLVFYFTCLLGLAGVYVFDLTLSSPTFVYFAQRFLNATPLEVTFWRYILPAALLLIEVMLSVARAHLAESTLPGESRLPVYLCGALAFFEALVMVSLVAAAQISLMPRDGASIATTHSYWFKTFGMASLALVLHGCVLLLGQHIQAALAYILCALRRFLLRRKIRAAEHARRRRTEDAARVFGVFMSERANHEAMDPDANLNIPFDSETCRVLNGEFDSPVIRTGPGDGSQSQDPSAGDSTPRPSGGPPPHASPEPFEAEAEYYRTVAEAQSRQREEEVKA